MRMNHGRWGWAGVLLALGVATASASTFTLTARKWAGSSATGSITSAPPGIICSTNSLSGSASFTAGSVVTLTGIPAPGYQFSQWEDNGTTVIGTNPTLNVTMNTDRDIYAQFTPISYTVTITKLGTGSGTVTSADGKINCGSSCTATGYSYGSTLTLTATPAAGSMFEHWYDSTAGSWPTNNVLTYVVPIVGPGLIEVEAHFSSVLANSSCFVDQWHRQFGTTKADEGKTVAVDPAGNLYLAGTTQGAFAGFSNLNGRDNAWLAKNDPAGNQLWVTQTTNFDSSAIFSVAADGAGNIYAAGETYNFAVSSNSAAGWFGKFRASDGSQVWAHQLAAGNTSANSIAVDQVGNVYVAGEVFGALAGAANGGNDAWLAKYDGQGNQLWIRQWGSAYDDGAYGVAVDRAGNAAVVGYWHQLSGSYPSSSAFLAKFDPTGLQVTNIIYGTGGWDVFNAVAVDACGNAYYCGLSEGNFGGTNAGNADAICGKVDSNGNDVWQRQIGTDYTDWADNLTVDRAGNVYVIGGTYGALGGPNAGGEPVDGGGADAWFARYDSNGNLQCITQLGSDSKDTGLGIAVDDQYNVYATGGTAGNLDGTSVGVEDAWVAKFSQTAVPTGSDLGLSQTTTPSPAALNSNVTFSVTVTNFGPTAFTGVTLTNALAGNGIVLSVTTSQGSYTTTVGHVICNLGTLANGAAATATIIVQPTSQGTLTNMATVSANEAELSLCNNRAGGVVNILGSFCSYSLAPTNQAVGVAGTNATVAVQAGNGCAWTVTNYLAWVSLTANTNGTGNGTVAYAVAANPSAGSRSGSLTIAGQTFTITQAGICTATIVTSASPTNGGATGGDATVACGSTVTVTATANACYQFVNWTDGATIVSTATNYQFSASASRSLVANFAPVTYSINASAAPIAAGTVSGGGQQTCGTSVTLTATPNAGNSFVNWTEGGLAVSSAPSYTFTVTGARNLIANFAGLLITTTSLLPNAVVGVAYNNQFQAAGGTQPYKWSASSGRLPAGLTLSKSGLLTGKPTQAGTTTFTIQVTGGASSTKSFSLTVVDRAAAFAPLAGTYTGLFVQTNMPTHTSSGFIQIVLAKTGAFAGNLTRAGKKTAFKGQFDPTGTVTSSVAGATVVLHLDLISGSGPLTGSVTGPGFTAELFAELPGTSPVGTYNLALNPADETDQTKPQGYGYATLIISKTGSGSLSGVLNDGTKLTAKAPVSQSGVWPLYISLYNNAGSCISWVMLDTANATGEAVWFAPASRRYAAFTTTLTLTGSPYTTGPLLTGTWDVTLSGGGLPGNLAKTVTLNAAGKVIGKNPLALKITVKTGQFSGSFTSPAGGKAIPFNGLLLQVLNSGAGLFQTATGQAGGITLEPGH